jgi:predicted dehydrogenase
LKTSDYSKCVYRCDNNVVDHQIVAMEFEGKVTANLTMTAFETGRHIEIFGSKGVLKGGQYLKRKTGCDVIVDLWNGETVSYTVSEKTEGDHHMGGDEGLMGAFYDEMVGEGNPVSSYIQSHVMAYAAEESRISNKKIELDEFVKSIINK